MRFFRIAVLIFIAGIAAFAQQDPRGTLEGLITDASGGLIPAARIRATNSATGVTISGTSNELGRYEIPFLLPGPYQVDAEHVGFKRWTQSGLEVRTSDHLRVDIKLELGNTTESIQVTAEAGTLEAASSAVGQVIGAKQSSDLPLRGGSLAWLYLQSPGVVLPALPAGGPWNIDQASNVSGAGGGSKSFDYNVDGVSNNVSGGNTGFVPPPDMVQEVRVDVTSYDAASGHSTGGSINISLKTGTNKLHGALGVAMATGPMITRNFFVNKFIFDPTTGPITAEKIKSRTPVERWRRDTAAVGGPVYIPRLYDGRNKTFWMFGYQGHNRAQPVTQNTTVPTLAQRNGDFSALLALGSSYQIYDPFTTKPSGTTRFQRQPLPGNIIPASRIDAAARGILKYFPLSNTTGSVDAQQNFSVSTPKDQIMHQPVVRVDHNFSQNNRLFARYSQTDFDGHFDQFVAGSTVRGRQRSRPHRGAALDDVVVLSPRMVLDVRYGMSWFREFQGFDNKGWDLKEFGFPASLISQINPAGTTFPVINVNGLLQLGNDGGFSTTNVSHSLLSVLSWMKKSHSLRFGADLRVMFENSTTYGNASPALNFDSTYTKGPLDNAAAAPAGQGLASFLFGIPSGGGIDFNDSLAQASHFSSLFVQDDWRVSRKLTLNLGLRWEYESPVTERYNRTTLDFDSRTANPIQAQAQAQYAKAPLAELPAANFRTIGGVTFAGVNGNPRGIRDAFWPAFMPRLGLAYQIDRRLVMRAGYGVYYALLGADFTEVAQPGFNQRTNVVPSLDNGQTYVASISNPFPAGVEKPKGAAGGLLTFLGRAPGFFARDGRRPYTQHWSASLQFEPMSRTVVELGYLGSRSVRQRVSTELDAVPAQYLSKSLVRDQVAIDSLSAAAANPFRGIDGFAGSALASSVNTTRSQLVRPYPQFTSLSVAMPAGSAWYNALTARFERRFAKGLQVQANYTWSKTMEATAYLNETDSSPSHVVSNLDRPHRLTANGIYELPFGQGRFFLRGAGGVLNQIVGGWQAQAIYTAQSGPPLAFGNVIYRGNFTDIRLPADVQKLDHWFNTSGFERASGAQPASNIRMFPLRISGARAPGINLWDVSAFKNFRLREGLQLQIRGEAEGAANHPNFGLPNMSPANTLFGVISSTNTGEGERRIFAGLKVIF